MPKRIHNHAKRGQETPTYFSWGGMIKRCTKPWCDSYPNYGGRGIKVCDRWLSFENFLADMGEKPEGLTLERVDNDGDYTPENCVWATRKAQQANRRGAIKVDGVPLKVVCEERGLKYGTVVARIRRYGWTIDRAVGG